MPYIPKEHEKYNLLPLCRKDGGEVWDYPSELILKAEKLLGSSSGLFPYNYDSYEQYDQSIEVLIAENSERKAIVSVLNKLKETVKSMNCKEEWSILQYVGPTTDECVGLTHGKNYYWPTRKDKPVYMGVIDDEEFTSYLYPTEAHLWRILEDPTGMAYRTIFEKGKGHISEEEYNDFMEQIERQFGGKST